MSTEQRWLLPEGIDELMPKEAMQLEILRRKLIDGMHSWGYQLVSPPMVEYLDSLLTGNGKTLDLQTFKLTDQVSGRLIGIRADMTPQVARIAAHNLCDQQRILRLCYIGSVLRTLPDNQNSARNPVQLGAEIYGHIGMESDMEIVQLMVETLMMAGVKPNLLLDFGHVGIYRALVRYAGLDNEQEQVLFSLLQRKALPEITSLLAQYQLPRDKQAMLLSLAKLNGDASVLQRAKQALATAPEEVQNALSMLELVLDMIAKRLSDVTISFDLAELRGYHYHTGIVFAAYQHGLGQAIAMGGRYDDIGKVFGHAQPATGFSLDLKALVHQLPEITNNKQPILLPWSDDAAQQKQVAQLRQGGEVVIYQLPDNS